MNFQNSSIASLVYYAWCSCIMYNDSETHVFSHNVGKHRSSWRVISHAILPWQYVLLWFRKLQAVEKVPSGSILNVKSKIHFSTALIQMSEFWTELSIWPELPELCLSKWLALRWEILIPANTSTSHQPTSTGREASFLCTITCSYLLRKVARVPPD